MFSFIVVKKDVFMIAKHRRYQTSHSFFEKPQESPENGGSESISLLITKKIRSFYKMYIPLKI